MDPHLEAQRLEDQRQKAAQHKIRWHWVKGHAENPGNIRADELANRGVPAAPGA